MEKSGNLIAKNVWPPCMKNQAIFSSEDKGKKSKCRLLQFLFGAVRVKINRSLSGLLQKRRCSFSGKVFETGNI